MNAFVSLLTFDFIAILNIKSYGHLTFLKDTEDINHISWQDSNPGVVGQRSTDSMVSVLLLVLVLFGILVGFACLFFERQRKE